MMCVRLYISRILLVLALLLPSALGSCIHDRFVRATLGKVTTPLASSLPPDELEPRHLQSSPLSPLRIKTVFYQPGMQLSSVFTNTLSNFLTAKLVPTAVAQWGALLTVASHPPLQAHRDCEYVWRGGATLKCSDFVTTTYCIKGFDEVEIPLTSYLGADVYYPNSANQASTAPAQSAGVADADFVLFVTAASTSACSSGVLAYAQTCQRDGATDRPTFGRMNFCPASLSTDAGEWQRQLSVALHEIGHALGFTDGSLPLFRAPDGTPRTPRSSYDPTQPADAFVTSFPCGDYVWDYAVAASSTVAFLPERGTPCKSGERPDTSFLPLVDGGVTARSDCVQRGVSPNMASAARYYHGCAALPGLELDHLQDKEDDNDCALYGSHWEGRVLMQELMAPYVSHYPILGPATLAFFADSGWYGVNWDAAGIPRNGDWGFKQGCAFAAGKCSAANAGSPPHWFFDGVARAMGSGNAVCTTDGRAIAYVDVGEYSSPIPPYYRYFSNPAVGGSSSFDFCPVSLAYSGELCNATALSSRAANSGETKGATSRCFASTLRDSVASSGGALGAGCYAFTCGAGPSVTVTLARSSGAAVAVTCGPNDGGSQKGVAGFSGALTCPTPAALCAAAAPRFYPVLASPSPTPAPVAADTLSAAVLFKGAAAPFSAGALAAIGASLKAQLGLTATPAVGAALAVSAADDAAFGARRRRAAAAGSDGVRERRHTLPARAPLDDATRRALQTAVGVSVPFSFPAVAFPRAGAAAAPPLSTLADQLANALPAALPAVRAAAVSAGVAGVTDVVPDPSRPATYSSPFASSQLRAATQTPGPRADTSAGDASGAPSSYTTVVGISAGAVAAVLLAGWGVKAARNALRARAQATVPVLSQEPLAVAPAPAAAFYPPPPYSAGGAYYAGHAPASFATAPTATTHSSFAQSAPVYGLPVAQPAAPAARVTPFYV